MAFTHSSVIVTGAAVDTRTRDLLKFPLLARPQAMTIYLRFVEGGAVFGGANIMRVLEIGDASATPRLLIQGGTGTSGTYSLSHITAYGTVSSTPAVTPTPGQIVEMRCVLNANGSVLAGISINGGAETVGATSAVLVLATAWSGNFLYVNSSSSNTFVGLAAYRNIEIVAGVKTMQEMRRLAKVV